MGFNSVDDAVSGVGAACGRLDLMVSWRRFQSITRSAAADDARAWSADRGAPSGCRRAAFGDLIAPQRADLPAEHVAGAAAAARRAALPRGRPRRPAVRRRPRTGRTAP